MKTKLTSIALGILMLNSALAQQPPKVAGAGQPNEPLGGQPPKGSKPSVKDWDYQIKYQRAFEAVLWNMPAVAIYSLRRAAFTDLGMKDNDIITYSAIASPLLEAITANSSTPYIAAYTEGRHPRRLVETASGEESQLNQT